MGKGYETQHRLSRYQHYHHLFGGPLSGLCALLDCMAVSQQQMQHDTLHVAEHLLLPVLMRHGCRCRFSHGHSIAGGHDAGGWRLLSHALAHPPASQGHPRHPICHNRCAGPPAWCGLCCASARSMRAHAPFRLWMIAHASQTCAGLCAAAEGS